MRRHRTNLKLSFLSEAKACPELVEGNPRTLRLAAPSTLSPWTDGIKGFWVKHPLATLSQALGWSSASQLARLVAEKGRCREYSPEASPRTDGGFVSGHTFRRAAGARCPSAFRYWQLTSSFWVEQRFSAAITLALNCGL